MRKYGLDWLRISVVFLLFPFHTARVFDGWEPFYVKDTTNGFSTWFVAGVGFWFMALLFVIAGYSTFYALQKRSVRGYIKERVLRLLVPFIFGLVLIVPIQGYCASLQQNAFSGNYLEFLGKYFIDFHDISGYTGGFTPAHLWFILYLFVISLCLLPLLLRLRTPKEGSVSPVVLLLGFVPMTLAQALPDLGGQNPFFYALSFLYGFLIARRGGVMETVRRMRFFTLAAAVILAPSYLFLANALGWPEGVNLLGAGIGLLRNLTVWLVILALMGLADAYLNKTGPVLSYLNQASYPVYVMHQSVLIVVAYFAVGTALPPAVKYLFIMFGTLVVSFALFEAFRRFAPTRFILGIKGKLKPKS